MFIHLSVFVFLPNCPSVLFALSHSLTSNSSFPCLPSEQALSARTAPAHASTARCKLPVRPVTTQGSNYFAITLICRRVITTRALPAAGDVIFGTVVPLHTPTVAGGVPWLVAGLLAAHTTAVHPHVPLMSPPPRLHSIHFLHHTFPLILSISGGDRTRGRNRGIR